MKVSQIIEKLEEKIPKEAAEGWDNPGLLAGRSDREVKTIFVALDATDQTIEEAVAAGADLMLTHHPLIFNALKQVSDQNPVGKKVMRLIEHGVSYYAMHTNYDVCRMADLNEKQLQLRSTSVLSVTGERNGKPEGVGRYGQLPKKMTLKEMAEFVKRQMELPSVLLYGDPSQEIQIAAVSGGSGKSLVAEALDSPAEVLITGDIDYHTALDALEQKLAIIDAGHYGTEYVFIRDMAEQVKKIAPDCIVKTAETHFPYQVI
jgi:dinuclear metal center YbgI/SA1388 family protein